MRFNKGKQTMKRYLVMSAVTLSLLACTSRGLSQHWSLGGNTGLSLLSGSAGFQISPTVEMRFNQHIAVGSEFSINTHYGAPIIWHPYFKYRIAIRNSRLDPYASVGPLLAFNVPGGPCFGFLFGGGLNIPIANRLSIVPSFVAGPIFGVGGGVRPLVLTGWYWGYFTYGMTTYTVPSTTVFAFSLRGGIRYEL